LFNIRKYS